MDSQYNIINIVMIIDIIIMVNMINSINIIMSIMPEYEGFRQPAARYPCRLDRLEIGSCIK